VVVLAGQQGDGGFELAGTSQAVLSVVQSAGGTVTADLTRQVGVLVVESSNALFADLLRDSTLVEEVGRDFVWKAFLSLDEALASGAVVQPEAGGGGPEPSSDPLEPGQWSMMQIRAPDAHAIQAGWRAVDVASSTPGSMEHTSTSTTMASRAVPRTWTARGEGTSYPKAPRVGNPDPCIDNGFHGTHVAGIVAAQANELGVVGVAPNVTLVPVKVCDTAGFCYASAATAGITYAGDAKLDVINMSFFVDDDELLASTEFKCMDDPTQRAFRREVERANQYARGQGVTPVAALGNSDNDLAHPPSGNQCDVVPAETSGVVGTMALGRMSQKASYSSYGTGATDVAAPGGAGTTGDCTTTVLSTFPSNSYGCIQGTSMASSHATGVAALILSQFGVLGSDGDVKMSPTKVEAYLQSSTVDIGLSGYDECFGNGRIDALRAVQHDTAISYDPAAPFCPEYSE
jgi:subtilisin family serine protease